MELLACRVELQDIERVCTLLLQASASEKPIYLKKTTYSVISVLLYIYD